MSSQTPQQISANVGDSVILKCAFDYPEKTNSPYVIHWYKDGSEKPIYIFYEGYPTFFGEGFKDRVSLVNQVEASLNISNIRDTDQGWYECKIFYLIQQQDQPNKNGTRVLLEVNCEWNTSVSCMLTLKIFTLNWPL